MKNLRLIKAAIGTIAEDEQGERFSKFHHNVGLQINICNGCGNKIWGSPGAGWTSASGGVYCDDCVSFNEEKKKPVYLFVEHDLHHGETRISNLEASYDQEAFDEILRKRITSNQHFDYSYKVFRVEEDGTLIELKQQMTGIESLRKYPKGSQIQMYIE